MPDSKSGTHIFSIQTLEPAAERISFRAFTMGEAVQRRNLEHRNLILGVDMRCVFYAIQDEAVQKTHFQQLAP